MMILASAAHVATNKWVGVKGTAHCVSENMVVPPWCVLYIHVFVVGEIPDFYQLISLLISLP